LFEGNLKELKTGNSSQEGSKFAVILNKEVMQGLKETTRHAKRHVFLRAGIIDVVLIKNSCTSVKDWSGSNIGYERSKTRHHPYKREKPGNTSPGCLSYRRIIKCWPVTKG
jgi:hypothetical protein